MNSYTLLATSQTDRFMLHTDSNSESNVIYCNLLWVGYAHEINWKVIYRSSVVKVFLPFNLLASLPLNCLKALSSLFPLTLILSLFLVFLLARCSVGLGVYPSPVRGRTEAAWDPTTAAPSRTGSPPGKLTFPFSPPWLWSSHIHAFFSFSASLCAIFGSFGSFLWQLCLFTIEEHWLHWHWVWRRHEIIIEKFYFYGIL